MDLPCVDEGCFSECLAKGVGVEAGLVDVQAFVGNIVHVCACGVVVFEGVDAFYIEVCGGVLDVRLFDLDAFEDGVSGLVDASVWVDELCGVWVDFGAWSESGLGAVESGTVWV